MKYKIADLIVEFNAKYEMTRKRAEKYACNQELEKDITIEISDKRIENLEKKNKQNTKETSEYMIIGTEFYKALLSYNGCLLHSSGVVIDDEAYLFSADPGTGKSTHTSLWLKYLKDKNPYIINDDKPAIRIFEDGIYCYGTPFSGKHDISENKKVKVKAICFIEQAKENSIRKIEIKESINLFFAQTTIRLNKEKMEKLLDIMEIVLKELPIYKLSCNISEEAVMLSYNTMKGTQFK